MQHFVARHHLFDAITCLEKELKFNETWPEKIHETRPMYESVIKQIESAIFLLNRCPVPQCIDCGHENLTATKKGYDCNNCGLHYDLIE